MGSYKFPAIMPSGNPLWPEFWSIEELNSLQSELPAPKWNAQYQQNPTAEEGALVKREWWKRWGTRSPSPMRVCNPIMGHSISQKPNGQIILLAPHGVYFTFQTMRV